MVGVVDFSISSIFVVLESSGQLVGGIGLFLYLDSDLTLDTEGTEEGSAAVTTGAPL